MIQLHSEVEITQSLPKGLGLEDWSDMSSRCATLVRTVDSGIVTVSCYCG